jgi:hypothetical protein
MMISDRKTGRVCLICLLFVNKPSSSLVSSERGSRIVAS